jgi:hypothetical protein
VIKEVTYYQVICDKCGADAQEGSDYSAWADRETARIEPQASDWLTDVGPDSLDLCNRCQGDEDDQRDCQHDNLRRDDDACPDCGLTVKVGARNAIERAELGMAPAEATR